MATKKTTVRTDRFTGCKACSEDNYNKQAHKEKVILLTAWKDRHHAREVLW